jgi:16S rRNA (cytidine1402-2'-O)-methyltransferase
MGTLYVVATPIGNLEDITLRALRVLREVRLIAAEDTRHTRKLLTRYEIATPTLSYHEHSPPARREALLAALDAGDVALVTDAGTPAISDPGYELVRAAIAAGHTVTPVPGASAAISALVASGLPTDPFTFVGFLPRKPAQRKAVLAGLRDERWTLVLYEAPHRLLACLDDLLAALGDREMAAGRELTKVHEEWLRGTISSVRERCASGAGPRGEYTLVVAGASMDMGAEGADGGEEDQRPEERARERLRALLAQGAGTREASARVAKELGMARRAAYGLALRLAAEGEKGEDAPQR